MRVIQATAKCSECGQPFAIQVYVESNESNWTLYSDGFLHYPNSTPPWHSYKICPHCEASVTIKDEYTEGLAADLPFADAPPPRDRVRAALARLPRGKLSADLIEKRRDLQLMDLWISNHLCGGGADDYTKAVMHDLLDPTNGLDPLIRADIQRQIGRFEAAREGLLSLQQYSKDMRQERRLHIKSVLALIGRRVKSSVPVNSDKAFIPPTGRLALHQHVTQRY